MTFVFVEYHDPSKSPCPESPGKEMLLTDIEAHQEGEVFWALLMKWKPDHAHIATLISLQFRDPHDHGVDFNHCAFAVQCWCHW